MSTVGGGTGTWLHAWAKATKASARGSLVAGVPDDVGVGVGTGDGEGAPNGVRTGTPRTPSEVGVVIRIIEPSDDAKGG
jgi:hypothetical protein